MKKYAAYLVFSALLMAAGIMALLASFAVYFRPALIAQPLLTVGQSLALFGLAYLALLAQGRAFEAAQVLRRADEQRQRLAQQWQRR